MAQMLTVALPKGRLGDKVYNLLESVGYDCSEIREDGRKLVFENPASGVRYLLVKPSDVTIYVEHGAADVGIVGKDILEESRPDVYELLDLGIGRCRMAVAARSDAFRSVCFTSSGTGLSSKTRMDLRFISSSSVSLSETFVRS